MSNTKNKARPTSIKITLAGVEYEIPPLTILQTRDIWAAVGSGGIPLPDIRADIKRNFDIPIEVIAAGLSVAYPDMTIEAVRQLPFSKDEMNAANSALCAFSGLTIVEDKKPGEASPGT